MRLNNKKEKNMAKQRTLDIQHGIWIDSDWLKKAGLGSHIQLIVQPGEIRIRPVPSEPKPKEGEEKGWNVFLSLEADALPGKFPNASTNHDHYLYTKDQ
jgi:hypothetical protein